MNHQPQTSQRMFRLSMSAYILFLIVACTPTTLSLTKENSGPTQDKTPVPAPLTPPLRFNNEKDVSPLAKPTQTSTPSGDILPSNAVTSSKGQASSVPTTTANIIPVTPPQGSTAAVASIVLAPSMSTITRRGENTSFFPIIKDAAGTPLNKANYQFDWQVKDPARFDVNSNGLVTALDTSGFTTVTITEKTSGLSASATITMGSSGDSGSGSSSISGQSVSGNISFQGL